MKILILVLILCLNVSCAKKGNKLTREQYLETLILDEYELYKNTSYSSSSSNVEVPLHIVNQATDDTALVVTSVEYLAEKWQSNMCILSDSQTMYLLARKMVEGCISVDSSTFSDLKRYEVTIHPQIDSLYKKGGIKALLQYYVNSKGFIFNVENFSAVSYLTYLLYQYNIFVSAGIDCEEGFYIYMHKPYSDRITELLNSIKAQKEQERKTDNVMKR